MSETFDEGHATSFLGNFAVGAGAPAPLPSLQLLPSVPDVHQFFSWLDSIGPSRAAPVLAVAAAMGVAAGLAGEAGMLPPLQPEETAADLNAGGILAGLEGANI